MFASAALPASAGDDGQPAGHAPARLLLRGLTKTLGGLPVVKGIDLSVAAGESVVLLGPSGCGKTTTLRMVAGFEQPSGGEVHLSGQLAASSRYALPPEKRRLGMMFQNYAVWPHKTVFENVAYGLRIAGVARPAVQERVNRMLETVNLHEYAARKPSELSGGQQQRVALARALVMEPSLLLLDEPLSNLDAAMRQAMRYELKALQGRIGVTMLYVTHDQDEALVLADRIVVMNQGVVEQIGTPEQIYREPASRFVASFIGLANLLEGEVLAIDAQASAARVRLDAGLTCWARLGGQAVQAGERRTLVVRPEHLYCPAPGTVAEPPRARIEKSAYLGNRYDLGLLLGEHALRAEFRHLPVASDGSVAVAIADHEAWVLP